MSKEKVRQPGNYDVLLQELYGESERLRLHQLRVMDWMIAANSTETDTPSPASPRGAPLLNDLSEPWCLLGTVELYPWQKQCVDAWFINNRRGTVKVVTGAGKTLLGLAIAQRLQNELDPHLRVAIVVPTIVLMNQWYDELTDRSNLPARAIGRLGGGRQDAFTGDVRILLCVLDSAQSRLPEGVTKAGFGSHLLLIVDECHRAGAPLMSRVLRTPRAYSLGLSATPERDEDIEDGESDTSFAESRVGQELGQVVFELTLADALGLGIIPPYTIKHYGLMLEPKEEHRYQSLSRAISDAREDLRGTAPASSISGNRFFAWVQKTARSASGTSSSLAAKFLADSAERKEIVYRASARFAAVEELLTREVQSNPNVRAILFHENIEAVNELFVRLASKGFPVVPEHSRLPQELRNASLELFRHGLARIIVSAKSLIEGFNVPAVDVGIIVASSTSARQRIQSMGRVLRRHRTEDGGEKNPTIHVLYVRKTIDELIYEREDWGKLTGADRNLYYLWTPGEDPEPQDEPPRKALPGDSSIDVEELHPGDLYPGRLEGQMFSCDTHDNITDPIGRHAIGAADVAKMLRDVAGKVGRFYVTPNRLNVLVRLPEAGEWVTRYVTRLSEPFRFQEDAPASMLDRTSWLSSARPGSEYPFKLERPTLELRFSQKSGGVLVKKIKGGESWALIGAEAVDPEMGKDAAHLLRVIAELKSNGETITHLEVQSSNDVLYRREGRVIFLTHLSKGLEFQE